MRQIRFFSNTALFLNKRFKLDPNYKFKCGLEIHTQLNTRHKLFSLSPTTTTLHDPPNTKISYFDVSLPGTQPTLNPEAVLYTLKLAIVLKSEICDASTFDRKHYFYADQPMGYQITQHYNPISRGGTLVLDKRFDDIDEQEKTIRFEQLQIEQDTGRSIYRKPGITEIDLNRANMPLVEIVTKPDFSSVKQVKAFIRKFQLVLKALQVCTGDMETGAMRIDVNLNVNDEERVELKNLPTTSAITSAIRYEYMRQVSLLKAGEKVVKETRGWDGQKTASLRTKETSTDYRYMPDPELPAINLDLSDLVPAITESLPMLPNETLEKLISEPYSCKLRDAMILLQNDALMQYYLTLFKILQAHSVDPKLAINWCCHELQGALAKIDTNFSSDLIPVEKLAELITLVYAKNISNNNAKMLLLHLLSNREDLFKNLKQLVDEFGLGMSAASEQEIDDIVSQVLQQNQHLAAQVKSGEKPNSINFLLGQCMKLSGGKIESKVLMQSLQKKVFE